MADSIALLLLAQQSVTTVQSVGGTGQLVNSTGMTNVFAWSVAAGGAGYAFRVKLGYTTTASAGLAQVQLQVSGGAATSAIAYEFDRRDSAATVGVAFRTATASVLAGPTLTSGVASIFELEGTVTFSTGGTFALQANCSVAADTWTIQPGSLMWLEPA